MELKTLSRQFLPVDIIDEFESLIWTERYYGDSEVQLVVPAKSDLLQKLAVGTFLSLDQTAEIMILETHQIEEGKATISGISLLKWLNNRFIRATAAHEDRYWYILGTPTTGGPAGQLLWGILAVMVASPDPEYADYPYGVPNPSRFKIYNIVAANVDQSGPNITAAIPYGPLYDAMREIAVTYGVGMTLRLDYADTGTYQLGFTSYRGLDRTSGQALNPPVRFSPDMEAFANVKELKSIADHKTEVYTYAPANPGGLATTPGVAWTSVNTGFDLRAMIEFEEDITTDEVGGSASVLLDLLTQRAFIALLNHKFAKIIDGEIVPTGQFTYGVDYNLGDVIEVQSHDGIVQAARVVEYIRSKDNVGEKAYPTLEMLT